MSEKIGILRKEEASLVSQGEILKGIGRENIQPVPFDLEQYHDHVDVGEILGHHCDSTYCPSKHCHREDLMQELLEAMEDLSNIDVQYMESLEETAENLFSRTISYLCVPLAFMDMFRAANNMDSTRRLARAAKAYRNCIVAVTKDLETQIDEKLLLKAFEREGCGLAAEDSNDWLVNALLSELRKVKTASHLDLSNFIDDILGTSARGELIRTRVVEGCAEKLIKTRLSSRIGNSRARTKIATVQSFQSLKANLQLDLFNHTLALDSFGILSDFLAELDDFKQNLFPIASKPVIID